MKIFYLKHKFRLVLCFVSYLLCFNLEAQDKTISSGNKPAGKEVVSKHKIITS